jgi:hypothetical protein
MNQEPSSWVSAPNVRKEDAEKKKRLRPLQTRPHFISPWCGTSCTFDRLRCKLRQGLGVRSFYGISSQGAKKGSVLMISDTCTLQVVREP